MIRSAFLLSLAAIVSAPVAAADSATSTPAKQQAKADKPEDKVICKFIETTGSRLSRTRVCQSRAQWDRDADAARDDLENGPRRPSGDLSGPN